MRDLTDKTFKVNKKDITELLSVEGSDDMKGIAKTIRMIVQCVTDLCKETLCQYYFLMYRRCICNFIL